MAALVVALAAIAGGAFALRVADTEKGAWRLTLGNALAGGVFLGAALVHLLGDAQAHMAAVVDSEVRWVAMLVGIGFLLVMVPERVVFAGSHAVTGAPPAEQPGLYPYLLALVLSIHSVIAGIALGLETDKGAFAGVLIAILAHKGSAAFALSAVLRQAGIAAGRVWRTLALFSVMTPAGIATGVLFGAAMENQAAELSEALFDALAAGTFLYVASMEIINEVFSRDENNALKFGVLLAGFALMAVLSVWT